MPHETPLALQLSGKVCAYNNNNNNNNQYLDIGWSNWLAFLLYYIMCKNKNM